MSLPHNWTQLQESTPPSTADGRGLSEDPESGGGVGISTQVSSASREYRAPQSPATPLSFIQIQDNNPTLQTASNSAAQVSRGPVAYPSTIHSEFNNQAISSSLQAEVHANATRLLVDKSRTAPRRVFSSPHSSPPQSLVRTASTPSENSFAKSSNVASWSRGEAPSSVPRFTFGTISPDSEVVPPEISSHAPESEPSFLIPTSHSGVVVALPFAPPQTAHSQGLCLTQPEIHGDSTRPSAPLEITGCSDAVSDSLPAPPAPLTVEPCPDPDQPSMFKGLQNLRSFRIWPQGLYKGAFIMYRTKRVAFAITSGRRSGPSNVKHPCLVHDHFDDLFGEPSIWIIPMTTGLHMFEGRVLSKKKIRRNWWRPVQCGKSPQTGARIPQPTPSFIWVGDIGEAVTLDVARKQCIMNPYFDIAPSWINEIHADMVFWAKYDPTDPPDEDGHPNDWEKYYSRRVFRI
ncbi:hypothetical protein CERSUDRAFT_75246 [Gelatoporia subvermispora B]|uniref:Uncharacterized protein n=1 Tax=Ceriporiopsis subvermispora (strain B) TaxID=914234 RepID=M2QCZ7_CERS8|nr:hypothetical protein CERSUDRAFT_75246 [Gelatoporia subvermispora B]